MFWFWFLLTLTVLCLMAASACWYSAYHIGVKTEAWPLVWLAAAILCGVLLSNWYLVEVSAR